MKEPTIRIESERHDVGGYDSQTPLGDGAPGVNPVELRGRGNEVIRVSQEVPDRPVHGNPQDDRKHGYAGVTPFGDGETPMHDSVQNGGTPATSTDGGPIVFDPQEAAAIRRDAARKR